MATQVRDQLLASNEEFRRLADEHSHYLQRLDSLLYLLPDFGIKPFTKVFRGNADAQAFRSLVTLRSIVSYRRLRTGRVAGIITCNHPKNRRSISHVGCKWPHAIE